MCIWLSALTANAEHSFPETAQSCVVAIVVPDVDVLKCWAHENRIPGTLSVLCNHPKVKELLMSDMNAWGKQCGLKSFEQVTFAPIRGSNRLSPFIIFLLSQVKDIYLHPDPFSAQNGLLTPAFKQRRPQIKNYFKPQLDDMYAHLV